MMQHFVSNRFISFLVAILLAAPFVSDSVAESQGAADPSAYKGWSVSSFSITGLEDDLASELLRGLALPGQRKWLRTRRPAIYPRLLQEDMQRTRLFLARRGYPYAQIRPGFDPSPDGRRVGVTLHVTTGLPVVVEQLDLEGIPKRLRGPSYSSVALKTGSVFSELRLSQSIHAVESLLRERGYAHARVEPRLEMLDSTRVALKIIAEPGAVYVFDGVLVEGVAEDLSALARKAMRIRAGQDYSPKAVEQANVDLRLLGLFRQIRLSTRDTGPETLSLHADLRARKSRMVEVGVGYWTDLLFTAHARWEHRNLFRYGRGMDVTGSYSRFRQDAGVSFWWPALFGSRTRGVIGADAERHREESYNLLSKGLRLGSAYRPSLETTIRAGITVSDVDLDIKTADTSAFVEQGGLLTILWLGWNRDTANDRVYPTAGGATWIRLEWAPPGSITESHFASAESFAAKYLRLAGDIVLAGRLGAGLAAPTGESVDLLPNKRFYAGGATSMRGFRRRKLGPLDDAGAPLGGEAKVEASAELRFPIVWRLRGALFADAGQVWTSRRAVSVDNVEVAVGPGLMILTPVGPIRADAGFRITDFEREEPDWVLHVTIGHPY
jgi:outer membrane protein assembly complex protein YaeT